MMSKGPDYAEKKGAFFSALLFLFFLSPLSCLADDTDFSAGGRPSEVRILIDISGSMKQTDPNNLRIPALNLLAELLPNGSRAGIWTFGQYVNNLLPVSTVDESWRIKAKAAGVEISSLGMLTNLSGALEDAAWGLKVGGAFEQSVILLTDGRVDMAHAGNAKRDDINASTRRQLLGAVLDKYRQADVHIHTLALSDLADKPLLQQLSVETNGLYSQAHDADQLMKVFLQAFDRAVPAEQVPMEDNSFVIDGSVKEFTALIFRTPGSTKQTQLLLPSGDIYSYREHPENVRWYQDMAFDLITVQTPETGTWVAEADLDPANRVTILSDLTLSVDGLPASLFPGDKLDVEIKLTNAGEVISKPELLRLTDISLRVVAASGQEGTKVLSDPENPPLDGVYYEALHRLKGLGQYQVDVIAEGRTFQRKRSFTMSMIQPVEVRHFGDAQTGAYRIEVAALSDNLDLDKTRVIAKLKGPDANTIIQSLEYVAADQAWVMNVTDLKGTGEYQVGLNIRGMTQSEKRFKVKPDSIRFILPYMDSSTVRGDGAGDVAIIEPTAEDVPSSPIQSDVSPESAVKKIEVTPSAVEEPSAVDVQALADPQENAERLAFDAESEASSGSFPTGLLALLAGLVGVILMLLAWLLLRRGKSSSKNDLNASERDIELTELRELEDEFAGDFDSLDEGREDDISLAPASMDDEAVEPPTLNDDFSIDPGEVKDSDEDSWGEFDADSDIGDDLEALGDISEPLDGGGK